MTMIWYWVLVILWIYTLSVLKRANLQAYYFWLGSVGLFLFLAFFDRHLLIKLMTDGTVSILKSLATLMPGYSVHSANHVIAIMNGHQPVQIHVDYEYSGAIETFAFVGLLWFFPVYHFLEKLWISVVGVLWIMIANILLLLLLIFVVQNTDVSQSFIVENLVSRLIFYLVIVALYYLVFTKLQVVRGWQHWKVGVGNG